MIGNKTLKNYISGNRSTVFQCLALVFLLALGTGLFFRNMLPHPLFSVSYSLVLYDRNGELLEASIAMDEQWRFPRLEKLPDKFKHALICYEDEDFFSHRGVDGAALVRAFFQNLSAGRIKSGGSTISMQVIRLMRNNPDRSIPEKLTEILLALRLEMEYDKEDILSLFASHAPFGGNVVGIQAASWRYFGREPDKLSWAESALLAVLPNSPGLIHPGRNRELLKQKRNLLLEKMLDRGILDELSRELAEQEPLPDAPHPLPHFAPHLLLRVRKENGAQTEDDQLCKVLTTVDKYTQLQVTGILERHIAHLSASGIKNCAACVINVPTGEVIAYAGNVEAASVPDGAPYVDIIDAPRSTGSVLKPLLYAAMLDAGELLPCQLVPDIPTRFGGFRPENDGKTFRGAVPADMALAQSLNVPAVRMLKEYGIDRFGSWLKSLGMTTLFRPSGQYGLALIVGGAEGSLWELTGIYAGLGRRALTADDETTFFTPTYRQRDFPGGDGGTGKGGPLLSRAAAWLTLEAMIEVERPGEDVNWRYFNSASRIAWKTGTSYGNRDAWAIGITPAYAVGVWVGNADGEGRPGLRGSQAAAPILFDIFSLLGPVDWFPEPEGEMQRAEVCAQSGFPKGAYCEDTRFVSAPRTILKMGVCPYCRLLHLDKHGRYQVTSLKERITEIVPKTWFILPPTMEWYYKSAHSDYKPVPPFRSDCLKEFNEAGRESISLIFPLPGSQVYIPIELNEQKGKIVCSAAHRREHVTIFWHLDEEYLGATSGIHQMAISPPPGTYKLTLIDENGEYLQVPFTVLSKDRS